MSRVSISEISEVAIAGCGIAACAVAVRLLSLNLRPLLLTHGSAIHPGNEAISHRAALLFQEIGLGEALENAGAERVCGFENAWNPHRPVIKPGDYFHVERRALALAALKIALYRGAKLKTCARFPKVTSMLSGAGVSVEGFDNPFLAAIDATGRSALWSQPVGRTSKVEIASMFEVQGRSLDRSRIVRLQNGWAYAIPRRGSMTLAVVGHKVSSLDESTAALLGVTGGMRLLGRRPAFPQWCEQPWEGSRIAVGDAALASSPIAGQGILFALQSAFACSAALQTIREDGGPHDTARSYYREFVGAARARHVEWLAQLEEPPRQDEPVLVPETVRFSAPTRLTGVQRNGRIMLEEAVELPRGGLARWVGGIDLLQVRALASAPVSASTLATQLTKLTISLEQAHLLIAWCVRSGLLADPVRVEGDFC
jgi:hypothetical protein